MCVELELIKWNKKNPKGNSRGVSYHDPELWSEREPGILCTIVFNKNIVTEIFDWSYKSFDSNKECMKWFSLGQSAWCDDVPSAVAASNHHRRSTAAQKSSALCEHEFRRYRTRSSRDENIM